MGLVRAADLDREILQRPLGDGAVTLSHVLALLRAEGARPLIVGGTVRDMVLGRPVRDVDVEVFGIAPDELERVLTSVIPVQCVGKAFAVYKAAGADVEFSLPRRDSLVGMGHRAFSVEVFPHLTFEEASRRRDFTMNAMGLDPFTGELLDPWGGLAHLAKGELHVVDATTFREDPLRVMRAAQFISRFRLTPSSELVRVSRSMTAEGLSPERVFMEWNKLLLGEAPGRGLRFLLFTGWIRFFPELAALVGLPQEPRWHPEGDVWAHVLSSVDAAVSLRTGDGRRDLLLMLAVLCHDMGKAVTTRCIDGLVRSVGHSEAGEALARAFLHRMTSEKALVTGVCKLVRWHLAPTFLFTQHAKPAAVRRLAHRLAPEVDIDLLVRCAQADYLGSLRSTEELSEGAAWLQEMAARIGVLRQPEPPVLLGRHLLEVGIPPGPRMGSLLKAGYAMQLEYGIRDPLVLRDMVLRAEASGTECPLAGVDQVGQGAP